MATTAGTSTAAPVAKITIPAASIIPQGVGAPPPPGLDPKKGKLMCIKVRMLDDTVGVFHLGHKAVGQALFDEVCRHLNLLECDYFGLEFLDCFGNRCWLDKEKSILKQITLARSDARFYFVVKFYTPTPADLEEEYTRYLFALQMKRDLASGQFVCNENTAALMASYIVQSECGDFSSDDYHDHTYLSAVRFVPNQSAEFEKKVMDNHKKLIGMSPAESDLALLETARRSEFYGVKFHGARDIEGTPVSLAVLHLGIKVYHQLTCASTFSWAKLRKLSFKRKKLFIKLLPESCSYYKDTIEFSFETRNECKMFWKKAVEHHAFFRCSETIPTSRHQSKFFTKGSSFRYSGRTQKQLIDYVREHHKRREPFTRPLHSSKTKKVNDERLFPTPASSLPGTLIRENGNLTISAAASSSLNREPRITENYQRVPAYAVVTPSMPEQNVHLYQRNEQAVLVTDQVSQMEEAANWRTFVGNNNEQNRIIPPPTNVIPPTPDTPQLKRKAAKGSATPAVTKQQITFHFPVTEISPDSPSSASDFGARMGDNGSAQASGRSMMADDRRTVEEWAAPPTPSSPTFPPMSPGGEGDCIEEDNVSEDSYHLAENEQIAERMQQQALYGSNRPYISTSLPMSAIRRSDDAHGCTCSDKPKPTALKTFGDRPTASSSLDVVYPSNSQPPHGFQPRDVELRRSPESAQRSPARGLTGPLPGRILPKGPVIVARTKPIPPPKPKMGLAHLEKSARGDYTSTPATTTSESITSPSMEPLIISQSTITTTEITVKKILDVCEPVSKSETSTSEAKAKKDSAEEVVVTKKVAFVTPDSSRNEDSCDEASISLPTEHSPSPAMITSAIFPSDTDSVSAIPPPPPPPPPIPPPVPMIEVQSEECPEIKHKIVNGDIPYILHVRHVKKPLPEPKPEDFASPIGSTSFSTFKEPPAAKTVSQQVAAEVNVDRTREQTPSSRDSPEASSRRTVGRRKSFDLVPRKRLPSPASFSSQDHSVSPDSEHDVAGYVSKFRVGHSKKGDSATLDKRASKRNDPRRMTQPIAPKPMAVKPKPARSQPCITGGDDDDSGDESVNIEAPSFHEGMDLLEKLDDGDRFSVGSGGEVTEVSQTVITETRTNTVVRFAPNVVADPPFIDDRASSESLTSADYDNLPPVRRSQKTNAVTATYTVRRSPQPTGEGEPTKSNGQRPPTGL